MADAEAEAAERAAKAARAKEKLKKFQAKKAKVAPPTGVSATLPSAGTATPSSEVALSPKLQPTDLQNDVSQHERTTFAPSSRSAVSPAPSIQAPAVTVPSAFRKDDQGPARYAHNASSASNGFTKANGYGYGTSSGYSPPQSSEGLFANDPYRPASAASNGRRSPRHEPNVSVVPSNLFDFDSPYNPFGTTQAPPTRVVSPPSTSARSPKPFEASVNLVPDDLFASAPSTSSQPYSSSADRTVAQKAQIATRKPPPTSNGHTLHRDSALQKQVSELSLEVEELRRQADEAARTLKTSQSQAALDTDAATRRHNEVNIRLTEAVTHRQRLENEHARLTQEITTLDVRCRSSEARQRQLESELQSSTEVAKKLETEARAAREVPQLRDAVRQQKAVAAALEEQLQQLQQQYESAQKRTADQAVELQRAQESYTAMQSDYDAEHKQRTSLESQLANVTRDTRSMQAAQSDARRELVELQQIHEKARSELAEIAAQLNNARTSEQAAKEAAAQAMEQTEYTMARRASLQKDNEDLIRDLEELREKIGFLSDDNATFSDKRYGLEQAIKDKDTEMVRVRNANMNLEGKLYAAEATLKERETAFATLREKADKLDRDYATTKEDLRVRDQELTTLRKHLIKATEEVQRLQTSGDSNSTQVVQLQEEVADSRREMKSLAAQRDEAVRALQALQQEGEGQVSRIRGELTTAQAALSARELALQSLQANADASQAASAAEVNRVTEQLRRAEEELQRLSSTLEEELASRSASEASMNEEIARVTAQLSEKEAEITTRLRKQEEQTRADRDEVLQRESDYTKRIDDAEQAVKNAQAELLAREAEMQQHVDQLTAQVEQYKQAADDVSDAAERKLRGLYSDVAEARKDAVSTETRYRAIVTELEAELQAHQEEAGTELARLRSSIAELTITLESTEQRADSREQELQQQLDAMSAEHKATKRKLEHDLQKQLLARESAHTAELEAAEAARSDIARQLQNAVKDKSEASLAADQQRKALQSQIDTLTAARGELEAAAQRASAENDRKIKERSDQMAKVEASSKQNVADLHDQMSHLQGALKSAQAAAIVVERDLRGQISRADAAALQARDELQQQHDAHAQQQVGMRKELDGVTEQMRVTASALDTAKAGLIERESHISQLESSLQTVRAELEVRQRQLDGQIEAVQALKRENEERLQAEQSAHADKIAQIDTEQARAAESHSAEIQRLNKQITDLQAELARQQDASLTANRELENTVEALKAQAAYNIDEADILRRDLSRLTAEIDEAHASSEETERALQADAVAAQAAAQRVQAAAATRERELQRQLSESWLRVTQTEEAAADNERALRSQIDKLRSQSRRITSATQSPRPRSDTVGSTATDVDADTQRQIEQLKLQQTSLQNKHALALAEKDAELSKVRAMLETSDSERMDVSQRLAAALHEHSKELDRRQTQDSASSIKRHSQGSESLPEGLMDVDEHARQIENLKGIQLKEVQRLRNQIGRSQADNSSLKDAISERDASIQALRDQIESLSEALDKAPYPLPPPSPHLDADHIDGLTQKHELELSRAAEKIRKSEQQMHVAQDQAHTLSKEVIDLQEKIAKLNTMVLVERDKAAKAMAEMFEATGSFTPPKSRRLRPGFSVNTQVPHLSPTQLSPRSLPNTARASVDHTAKPGLRSLSPEPAQSAVQSRTPSISRRSSHSRSVSHAPSVNESLPIAQRSDFPFSPVPDDPNLPKLGLIEATPDIAPQLPRFENPFNASPVVAQGPITAHDEATPAPTGRKLSSRAKHARRESLQLLQARIEDEMGVETVHVPSASSTPRPSLAGGTLHPQDRLSPATVTRLTKRASVGDEHIWCPACKGDLIII